PVIQMYPLGVNFAPANLPARGLRYHGAGAVVSQLRSQGMIEAVDIPQTETFAAAPLFARSECMIPDPAIIHSIAAAIREAQKANEEGTAPVILFNLSGHGLIDMTAYDQYHTGDLSNYQVPEEEIKANTDSLEKII
ncbi:MAG: TrpB-like pyridoxal-phosphate dependent enzyme, partial [Muribaculaceae bacterium]|nr:TrpB-like pyridoxal-phosphate dependent enzyme [Muribaculaceae bacterium]